MIGTSSTTWIRLDCISVTSTDSQAPSVPTGVSATPQSHDRVQVSWTASTDNAAVVGYKVYRNGAFAGATTGLNYTDGGLTESTTYSYTVSAFDAVGNESAQSSPAVTATTPPAPDTQAPSMPGSVTATAKSPSVVQVSWSASTDNVSVTGYKILRNGSQIGTSVTASYTDTGRASSTTYSYTVSAYDGASNNSAQSSPAATATTMTPISIGAAKQTADPSTVGLINKIVTAVFGDCFYVEESDRNVGIKVVPVQMPAGIEAGKTVDVGGTMQTGDDDERRIGNATATLNSTGSVGAISLNNKAIGGGDWLYNSGNGAGQKGVKDGSGANNIGLLIRTWGKVTYKGSDHFYLDDGSALAGESGRIGVKVLATGLTIPDQDTHVTVTGISSCYKSGPDLYRQILVGIQTDITPMP